MQKYRDSIINSQGRPVQGATVAVTTYPSGVAATIYSNNGLTPIVGNTVTTDSAGAYAFYAADGRYNLSISGPGITAVSVTDILLEDPQDANSVNISGGTINSTPIGATTPSTGAFTTLSAVNTIQTGTNAINGVNIVNGPASGTAGGSAVIVQNTGTPIIAIGNKSALVGGAYDATPYIYSLGTINTNAGLSVTGALSATGGVSAGGTSNFVGGIFNNNNAGNQLIQTSTNNYATGLGIWAGGAPIVVSSAGFTFRTGATLSAGIPTGGTDVMTLDTSGNLGLGVTPSYKFDVASNSDAIAGNFRGRSADGISVLRFADNANTETARIDVRTTGLRLTAAGTNPVTVNSPGGLGYGTGAGGTVTQLTSKSTPVTLNTPTGRVTTFNDSLAAGAQIGFSINNSLVALTDTVVLTFAGTLASVNANYSVRCAVGTGTIFVTLKNESAGALLESVPINFAIIKGVTA